MNQQKNPSNLETRTEKQRQHPGEVEAYLASLELHWGASPDCLYESPNLDETQGDHHV